MGTSPSHLWYSLHPSLATPHTFMRKPDSGVTRSAVCVLPPPLHLQPNTPLSGDRVRSSLSQSSSPLPPSTTFTPPSLNHPHPSLPQLSSPLPLSTTFNPPSLTPPSHRHASSIHSRIHHASTPLNDSSHKALPVQSTVEVRIFIDRKRTCDPSRENNPA